MTKSKVSVACLLCSLVLCCSVTHASEFHATTTGSSSGNGTLSRPWDLQTALSRTTIVRPGDIMWIHGGTYRGHFTCTLSGTAALPITIRNFNSERVTLVEPDGAEDILRLSGDYVWVWGLEMMSTGSTQTYFPAGINFQTTAGCKAINCIIHDALGAGISNLNGAAKTEVYGCLLFYNGRSTGGLGNYNYGTYTQNVAANGQKAMRENIVHYNWYMGIHAYSERSNVDNMKWEGNVVYNNGYFRRANFERNFLLGGGTGVTPFAVSDTLKDNYFYYPSSPSSGARVTLGYYSGSIGLSLTGNHFIRGVFDLKSTSPAVTGNTFYRNTYEGYNPSDFPNNSYPSSATGQTTYVRPNRYENGRANIIVFNWAGNERVSVDVSGILKSGDVYVVRDALNYFGTPVASGRYDGQPISIPMTGLTCATPQGTPAGQPFHTGPEFCAFVLQRTGQTAGKPTGSLETSQDTLPPGGGNVTLRWISEEATSAWIEPGIGEVPLSGSIDTRVVASTLFKLTLSNGSDTSNDSASVVVAEFQSKGERDVTASGNPVVTVTAPCGKGNTDIEVVRDGVTPYPGSTEPLWQYDTFNPDICRSFEWFGYTFPTPYFFSHVAFEEGLEYASGGFFISPRIQVLNGGEWEDVENLVCTPPYAGPNGIGYETYDFTFSPVCGEGIRIAGIPGGDTSFVSVAELRALVLPETPVPVQLASFTALATVGGQVSLAWTTISEVKSLGFEVQRKRDVDSSFVSLPDSFVAGHGTTLEPHQYSYVDENPLPGQLCYRLKQIDLDGSISYCHVVSVQVSTSVEQESALKTYALEQNYPNPFNPSTRITYSLPKAGAVSLRVYNMLGQEVAVLTDGYNEAGSHQVEFDANTLSDGVYFYALRAGDLHNVKSMILLK